MPFALLDGGNGRHLVDHGGPLNVATIEDGIPITFTKAVHALSFAFNIISVDGIEEAGVTTIFGPNARLEKGNFIIPMGRYRGLYYLDIYTGTYPGGVGAAPRRRHWMPGFEAIAAPTHDAPTLPIHGSTISVSETRLHRPT